MLELFFHCHRRDMQVAKDLTDCSGCPLRVYPTPCEQYKQYNAERAKSRITYHPSNLEVDPKSNIEE